jgi:hypothetical protein
VDGVHALFGSHCNDAMRVQIGLHWTFSSSYEVRFVGFETMQAQSIFLRIDRHRSQAQLGGSAENTDGDLTTVQSKQFFHGRPVLGSRQRRLTFSVCKDRFFHIPEDCLTKSYGTEVATQTLARQYGKLGFDTPARYLRPREDRIPAPAIFLSAPCGACFGLAGSCPDEHDFFIRGSRASGAELARARHAHRFPFYRRCIINGICSQRDLSSKEGKEEGFHYSFAHILHRLSLRNNPWHTQRVRAHAQRN